MSNQKIEVSENGILDDRIALVLARDQRYVAVPVCLRFAVGINEGWVRIDARSNLSVALIVDDDNKGDLTVGSELRQQPTHLLEGFQ